jgi:SWI/SNF-related matrix-associated actin-dependent regulator of chromatin subfamily A3
VTESSRELVICDLVARLLITVPNATLTPQTSNKFDIVQQDIMSNLGKRVSSWVDLTGSDDENSAPQPKQARVSASQSASASSQPRPSQSFRDAWIEADEEVEILDLSQDADEGNGWVCVGAIDGRIVGIRYYDGYATMGEQVMIRREPGNPYDSNAIRINNVQGTQIGHLPRNLAAKLAPFMVGHVLLSALLTFVLHVI